MYLAAALVFFVLLLILSIQNPNTVELRFLTWKTEIPQVMVIMSSAVFGALIVGLIALVGRVRLSIRVGELNRQVRQLEDELCGRTSGGGTPGGRGLE